MESKGQNQNSQKAGVEKTHHFLTGKTKVICSFSALLASSDWQAVTVQGR